MLVNIVKKLVIVVKANCFCSLCNRVDHERIKDVGPDRAASEWLLRCGAMVRYHGQERWQKDYNNLPTGPLDKYKIQAIDATDSCIMSIGFDHLGNYPILCLWEMRPIFSDILLQLNIIVIGVSFLPIKSSFSLCMIFIFKLNGSNKYLPLSPHRALLYMTLLCGLLT